MDSSDGACLTKEASNMDVTLDDEPLTQPIENDDETLPDSQESMDTDEEEKDPNVYGYLLPIKPAGPMILVNHDVFTVGRSIKNHCHITKQDTKNFDAISKVHFILRKQTADAGASEEVVSDAFTVFIQDKSSNGTFVNGRKIGKEKQIVLDHNAMIGLAGPKVKHYVFFSPPRDYSKRYPSSLRQKYTVSRELGKGACGTVYLGIKKDDHSQVAIKTIDKVKVSMVPGPSSNIMNEVKLLQQVDHPCIIRLEDVIETDEKLYIILELADGGELFDKIIAKTKFQETEAKLHFYQIVAAIEHLHSRNIAHRDLKPENILLCTDDDSNPVIKVTDLGLSKFVDMDTHLKTFCGTPQYLAPEVLFSRVRGNGTYDLKVDMWSLGVILYILLCGCPPFNPDRSDKPLIRQVTDGDFGFPSKLWGNISEPAIDLVKKLMTVDPSGRLSAMETLQHPWMRDDQVIEKALALMDTQRRPRSTPSITPGVSCLNGILPEDWSEAKTVEAKGEDVDVLVEGEQEITFKRPLDEKGNNAQPCKRVKKQE